MSEYFRDALRYHLSISAAAVDAGHSILQAKQQIPRVLEPSNMLDFQRLGALKLTLTHHIPFYTDSRKGGPCFWKPQSQRLLASRMDDFDATFSTAPVTPWQDPQDWSLGLGV